MVSEDIEPLGHLIGLPGETAEIQERQVYVDGKKLSTFYEWATSLGLTEDKYFERVDAENVEIEEVVAYFHTSMEPISVGENTVFVLVGMWNYQKLPQILSII